MSSLIGFAMVGGMRVNCDMLLSLEFRVSTLLIQKLETVIHCCYWLLASVVPDLRISMEPYWLLIST